MYVSIYFVFIANTGMAKTETRDWHTSHEYAMDKCETRIISYGIMLNLGMIAIDIS